VKEGSGRGAIACADTCDTCRCGLSERDKTARRDVTAVSAEDLAAEYEADELAADLKYKGNTVITTGVIQSIGKDLLGSPYIVLVVPRSLPAVQCSFPRDSTERVARLSKGKIEQVTCTVRGKLMNVLLVS
jgi:hypothetical protein